LGEERVICARVVDRLKGEFSRAARLQAILWEQEPLTADLGFQEQIPLPSQTDVVVLLLWSRLGYRLHSRFKTEDEQAAPTGTLFEFRDAINARRTNPDRVPDVLVYRKTAEPPKPSITDSEKYLEALEEWRRVEAFFNSEFFRDANEGAFTGAFHTFKRAGEFEENFERHLRAMIVRRLGEDQAAGPSWTRGSPFRGLETFDFEHRDLFAGRARAVAEVLDALRRQAAAGRAFVLITGMSGGGKSSLARAGALPDLIQPGVIEGIGLWRWAVLRPGEARGDLFRGLAEALLPPGDKSAMGVGLPELAGETGNNDPGDWETAVAALAGRLRQNPAASALLVEGALRHAAEAERMAEREKLLARRHESAAAGQADEVAEIDRQLAGAKPPQARLALLVDQMEELFTDPRLDHQAREAFLVALDALARGGRTWVLATLRSDFFARCETNPILIELMAGDGTYRLLPPSGAEISRMICRPAAAAGLHFEHDPRTEESLADVLLAAAARDTGALPLLEFTLDELYKKAAAENRQTLARADYDALGGLEGALATRAEAVFGQIQAADAGAADALPVIFGALARLAPPNGPGSPGGPAAVVTQSASLDRFAPAAATLVRAMIDARLLVSDRGQVRVAHEALLRHWSRARDWIAENEDFLRARIRVAEAAARWRAEGEAEDFLLPRGKPLAEGEDLLGRRRSDLAPEDIAFIEASIAARRRQENAETRRRRRVLTAISSALVLALIFAGISLWQYGKAEAAARRATHARNEAEKLIEFMGVDLRDKLKPIGRLELLDSANQRVRAYYDSFGGQGEADSGILSRESMALLNQGDILSARGDLPGALKTYRSANEIRQRLVHEVPDNAALQADLATSEARLGDALAAMGNLPDALADYRESLSIRQRIARREPGNIAWQRDLAGSWTNVADTLQLQGDLPGALKSYREAEAIDRSGAQARPGDRDSQRGLFFSALNIGDVMLKQNDLSGALESYRRGSALQQQLCDADPKNAPWQRDLAVSFERIGDALDARGDHAGALKQYQAGLAIHRKLAAQDPTNTDWQSDLFVAQLQVGDMLRAQHDIDGALQQYADGVAIQQKLIDLDATNTTWQRNFSVAFERVGQALLDKQDAAGALKAFSDSLDVRRRLSARDATNLDWEHDVFVSLTKVGDVQALARALPKALQSYEEALVIQQRLAADDPTNAGWQRDLAETQDKAGQMLEAQENVPEALLRYHKALTIYETLAAQSPADDSLQSLVASVSYHLGRAAARQQPPDTSAARAALERACQILRHLQAVNGASFSTEQAAMLDEATNILAQHF
jgi:tetratricopeptide (TPR) repeat protein